MIAVKTYQPGPCRTREILRYAGAGEGSPQLMALLESCLEEAAGKLACRVCWDEFPIAHRDSCLDFGFALTDSKDLKRNLRGCESIVVFGATVGLELDRLIAKYSRLAPARALLLQAMGAERIESLCDLFQEEIREERRLQGRCIMPRFSPGYGDLPLAFQEDIFRVLDCPRRIGLTLNESLLMSPSKSVTAVIGVKENAAD